MDHSKNDIRDRFGALHGIHPIENVVFVTVCAVRGRSEGKAVAQSCVFFCLDVDVCMPLPARIVVIYAQFYGVAA